MNISEIRFSKVAKKYLVKMDAKNRTRVLSAIDGLLQIPPIGDVKPMEGEEGYYRLRVGGYRVVYHYDRDGVLVILFVDTIGPRGDVYK